jgi:hypothetical protein
MAEYFFFWFPILTFVMAFLGGFKVFSNNKISNNKNHQCLAESKQKRREKDHRRD